MKKIVDNKGVIIFYLCMILVMVFSVTKVDKNNDYMMNQKSEYQYNDN